MTNMTKKDDSFLQTLKLHSESSKKIDDILFNIIIDEHSSPVRSDDLKKWSLDNLSTVQLKRLHLFSKSMRAILAVGQHSLSPGSAYTCHFFIVHAVYYGRCESLFTGLFKNHCNVNQLCVWGKSWGNWSRSTILRTINDLVEDGLVYKYPEGQQTLVLSTRLNIKRRGLKALKSLIYTGDVLQPTLQEKLWVELKYPINILRECKKLIADQQWAFQNVQTFQNLLKQATKNEEEKILKINFAQQKPW